MAHLYTTSAAVARALQHNGARARWQAVLVDTQNAAPMAEDDGLWSDGLAIADDGLNLSDVTFAKIVQDFPLYRHAIELEIDRALFRLEQTGSPHLTTVENSLTLLKGRLRGQKHNLQDGGLCHMFLEHLECDALIHLMDTIAQLPTAETDLRPLSVLLGRHPEHLLSHQDGWQFAAGHGAVFLGTALPRAKRNGTETAHGIDDSVAMGRAAAQALHMGDDALRLNAWRSLDAIQAKLCEQLDAVFRFCSFGNLPPFARSDMFSLMRLEAMKQVHAEQLHPLCDIPAAMQLVVDVHRQGLIDPTVEKIVGQFLSYAGSYEGAAGQFVTEASRRSKGFA